MAAHIQQQQDATPPADADTSSDANSATTSAPTASWLPQRTSTHPLVLLVQTSVLLLTALLYVAAIAAPTYLLVVIISWLGLQTAYALTGPVLVGCNWALALLCIGLRRMLVSKCEGACFE